MFAFNFGMNHRDESKCMFCVYYADKTERLFLSRKRENPWKCFYTFYLILRIRSFISLINVPVMS